MIASIMCFRVKYDANGGTEGMAYDSESSSTIRYPCYHVSPFLLPSLAECPCSFPMPVINRLSNGMVLYLREVSK